MSIAGVLDLIHGSEEQLIKLCLFQSAYVAAILNRIQTPAFVETQITEENIP